MSTRLFRQILIRYLLVLGVFIFAVFGIAKCAGAKEWPEQFTVKSVGCDTLEAVRDILNAHEKFGQAKAGEVFKTYAISKDGQEPVCMNLTFQVVFISQSAVYPSLKSGDKLLDIYILKVHGLQDPTPFYIIVGQPSADKEV